MITVDGRPVVSRADLHRKYGYAMSTLERWWAEREHNAHPPVTHRIGNTLYWDEKAWTDWHRRHRSPTPPAGARTRDELATGHNLSRSTLERLWAEREHNAHPPVTHRAGRTLYWDAKTWSRWYHQLTTPTPPPPETDHTGDTGDEADDEIGPTEFARILGHKDNSWVSKAARVPPDGFPAPRWEELPSGRRRPKWRRRAAHAYRDSRTTPAVAPARRAGRRNKPDYLYAGDPRLQLARQALTDHPDHTNARLIELLQQQTDRPTSYSSWQKILTTARTHPQP